MVTNLDITATALDLLGLRRSVDVLGNAIVAVSGPASVPDRIARAATANRTFIATDAVRPAVAGLLRYLAVVVFMLVVLITTLASRLSAKAIKSWLRVLRVGVLLLLALPLAAWLMFILAMRPPSAFVVLVLLAGTSVLLVTLAYFSAGRVGMRVPIAGLSLLTAITLVAEQFFGAPLSLISLLSYSPLLGWRYYGMGNEAAAMAFGSGLMGVALLLDQWPNARLSVVVRRWGLVVFGALVVVAAAAPFLGANVGVAVWGTVGFAIAGLSFSGRRLTLRRATVIALIVVILVASFSAIELLGSGEQTHLGRALVSARHGGLDTLWTIVARKAVTSASVLGTAGFAWILAAVVGLAVFARWRPHSDWPQLLAENPHFAKAITAAAAAAVISLGSEDSGIVILSLIALYVGAAMTWLMLARLAENTGEVSGR
jgi:hypothetical protein